MTGKQTRHSVIVQESFSQDRVLGEVMGQKQEDDLSRGKTHRGEESSCRDTNTHVSMGLFKSTRSNQFEIRFFQDKVTEQVQTWTRED